MDGVFAGSSVNSSINLTADVFANGNGDYTVSVRSVKNGKMSAATQITYTFKDEMCIRDRYSKPCYVYIV